jgi:Zn-dependent peptidase ImmA (M78 family)/DNA-binding XRE family transcriptional regulator
MLTMARQAREMTQEDLAVAVGVSQARISKIEHGLAPADDIIEALATQLDYPREFFYQEGHNYGLPIRHHRKRASLGQRALDRIHAAINIRALQLRELLNSASVDPELELRRIDVDTFDGAAEEIARAVRSFWRVPRGPIGNLMGLLERAGIVLIPMDFGEPEIDAIAQVVPGLPPMIFFSTHAPMDRLRFTLAHELGHLVMHALPTPTMEKEANRFAAEFLMPSADIVHQLTRVTLPLLATLKAVWRVSMAALLERARNLQTITQRQYIRLRSELSRCGYLRREPAEIDVSEEHPALLKAIVAFHVEQLGYGPRELAKVIRDRPHRVRATYFGQAGGLQLVG